jgi:hypothetical protein
VSFCYLSILTGSQPSEKTVAGGALYIPLSARFLRFPVFPYRKEIRARQTAWKFDTDIAVTHESIAKHHHAFGWVIANST